MGAHEKHVFSGPTPDLLEQKPLAQHPVLGQSLQVTEECRDLRTTALRYPRRQPAEALTSLGWVTGRGWDRVKLRTLKEGPL